MGLDALALLDIEGSERFVLCEEHVGLVPARDLPWEDIAQALEDDAFFMHRVAPDTKIRRAAIPLLRASWAAQQGLVADLELERLLWTVRNFSRELEYDLAVRCGEDLGAAWRARRWRYLLNLIDRLPRATWTYQSMSNHPEYAEKVAQAALARKDDGESDEWAPPLVENTPEVAALFSLIDAVNALRTTLIMANSKPGSAVPHIPPHPRPKTLVDRMAASARRRARWAAHESLANRILRNRKTESD